MKGRPSRRRSASRSCRLHLRLRRSDAGAPRRRRSQRLLPLRRRRRRRAQRATLVDDGVLKGFLLSRSPTRGFSRIERARPAARGARPSSRARATWWCSRAWRSPTEELRRHAARGGQAAGQAVRPAVPRHLGRLHQHRARRAAGVQGAADPGLPRVGRRPARRARARRRPGGHAAVGADARSWPPANDYQTFNGYCGAESGFVPVSATSPSLLVQQIEIERRDKGSDKPPVLPAPSLQPAPPDARPAGQGKSKATEGRCHDSPPRACRCWCSRWARWRGRTTSQPRRLTSRRRSRSRRAFAPTTPPSSGRCRTSSPARCPSFTSATSRARTTSATRSTISNRRR